MIKLFYAPGTCALAPHIVLEWIGEPYELQRVKPSVQNTSKLIPSVNVLLEGTSRSCVDCVKFLQ
ncbi:MAG: hypothetical protein JOZ78_17030 [Chroococcidiopsidaceae cyanobacterium CP_BM_ER_R8_30]|nr:hypothetical protein [Chroococcidiopsidaceae cyanobacterium CP_BM_ER_R8_30]